MVKEVADTATPYVRKGLEVAGEVAAPVVRAAEPVVKVGEGPPAGACMHGTLPQAAMPGAAPP